MTDYKFILNQTVRFEEDRHHEFKEIKGGNPIDAIKNAADEYVVGFLNSGLGGGSIYWGINDSGVVVGVKLNREQRDELRRKVSEKLSQIKPAISPAACKVEIHDIYDETSTKLGELYIVEIIAPQRDAQQSNLYSTGGDEVFIKVDGAKKKLTVAELQDEIKRRASSNTLPYPEALQKYLDYLIIAHQRLRWQGIRAGSQPLSIDLEKVYVSLTAMEKGGQGGLLTIPEALKRHKRLVIIGDPGSGKTTLLAYLALTYARTLRDGADAVQTRLQLNETQHLPILLPLRDLGRHLLAEHKDSSKDGAAILLNYLREYYQAQTIHLPEDFFANALEQGRAVLLLDGMDEVAEKSLRQRVARLIEKLVQSYKHDDNRFIVTSLEVGYEGVARISENFGLAKVRDFNRAEVRAFVRDWTRAVETTLAGNESPVADEQAENLIKAIENNQRIIELAVNPLLLTVIALVHRYNASLPDRRSELYKEAIEVLLGHWDEAKGLETEVTLGGKVLDSDDRRSLLEPVAFWMHEQRIREIELDQLRELLLPVFNNGDAASATKTFESFIRLINERSGLLIERGVGAYSFAHLTFQEYLTARVVADRADATKYIV
ncbi:MAG: putative DNA binding domain-containing protein, partial [Chloroflexi bacterium]|nr:putative DNA binding domain-containing protein [Chloroflexota bacterium]